MKKWIAGPALAWLAAAGVYAARTVPSEQPGLKAPPGAVLVAYAREYQLEMFVGQYDPVSKRYIPQNQPFVEPDYQALFTLFGAQGKIQGVHLQRPFRPGPNDLPWDWNVVISTWARTEKHNALALSGDWPDVPRPIQVLPLNHPPAVAAVVAFLKKKKLDVPAPRITEVLQTDLDGDGQEELVVCANSDSRALKDDAPAPVYAVSLIVTDVQGVPMTLPLRVATFYKPAIQSVDEHERLHGRLRTFQVLALADVDADGRMEVAIVFDNREEGPEVDLYEFAARKVQRVLSVQKVHL